MSFSNLARYLTSAFASKSASAKAADEQEHDEGDGPSASKRRRVDSPSAAAASSSSLPLDASPSIIGTQAQQLDGDAEEGEITGQAMEQDSAEEGELPDDDGDAAEAVQTEGGGGRGAAKSRKRKLGEREQQQQQDRARRILSTEGASSASHCLSADSTLRTICGDASTPQRR